MIIKIFTFRKLFDEGRSSTLIKMNTQIEFTYRGYINHNDSEEPR